MNRAFVSENDGWQRCVLKLEDCMFADERGQCSLGYCRKFGEQPPEQPPQQPDAAEE